MKDKINQIVGASVIWTLKLAGIVSVCIIISIGVFETQRDEIWLTMVKVFEAEYEIREDELKDQYGIVDEDDVDQKDQTLITNISFSESSPKLEPRRFNASSKLLNDIAVICVNKVDTIDPEYIQKEDLPAIKSCMKDQLDSAIIIDSVFFKTISEMEDSPGKTIFQAMMVKCIEGSKNADGIIDHHDSLKCMNDSMDWMQKKLDEITKKDGI